MSVDLGSINYSVNADTTGLDAAYVAADKMDEKTQGATTATEALEKSVKTASQAANKMAKELDAVGNSAKKITNDFNMAPAVSQINATTTAVSALDSKVDVLSDTARKSTKNIDQAAASTKNLGNLGRQAGFQFQDAVVQLQGGANAALVFSQQGSQLLSVFHPLLGLAAAVAGVAGGILFSSFMANSKALSDMSENTKELVKDLNNLSDAQKGVVNNSLSYSIADQTKKYEAQTKEIENQTNRIRELNAENGRTKTVATGGMGGGGAGTMTFVVDNTKMLDEATRQLTATEVERLKTLKEIQALQDPSGSMKKIQSLTNEAELVGKTGKEYWQLKAAQEGITGAAEKQYIAIGMLNEQKKEDLKTSQEAAREAERLAKAAEERAKQQAIRDAANEKRRQDSIEKLTAQMRREADLFGVNTKLAQTEYDILSGLIPVIGGLEGAEGRRLITQAKRIDQMNDEVDLAKLLDAEIDSRLEKEKKAANKLAKDAKDQADDISKAITDGLMRGFESGKGLMENLKDTAENIFKTMVFRPSIEIVTKQLTSSLSGLMSKLGGGGAAGGSGSGGGGGAMGMLGMMNPYALAAAAVVAGVSEWNKNQDKKFEKMEASYKQANQGMSAVLGEGNKKSQAIANGIERLNNNNTTVLDVNYGMLSALLDIRDGLGNVAAGFSKTLVGGADYKSMGIKTGKKGLGDVSPDLGNLITKNDPSNNFMAQIGKMATEFGGAINTKILNTIFNKKTKVIDSGIGIIGGALADILTGTTLEAFNYADKKTTKKIIGVTASTKVKRVKEDLDQVFEDQISDVFKNAGQALKLATTAFGLNFDDFSNQLLIKSQDLSLKGLEGDALQKEIESFFGSQMDAWAQTILGGTDVLLDFQNIGESAFDTMLRLASETNTFVDYVDRLNLNMKATGLNAVYATQTIADLSGGFDKLSSDLSTYYKNFFDDGDQLAETGKQVTKYFNDLHLAVPASKAAFKGLVEGLDLATDAGQKQFSSLMAVSGAMSEYLDAQEKIKKSLVDDAYAGLDRAVAAQKKIIDAQINTANKALTVSQAVYSSLQNTLKGLVIDSAQTRAATRKQAQNELSQMLQVSRRGMLPDIDKLNSALSTISQPSENLYSTFDEYADDFYKTADTIKQLQSAAGNQVSIDEKNLIALELANEKYDQMLEWAKAQVDVMNGVDVSVKSVSAAMLQFASAVGVSPQSQAQIMASLAQNAVVPADPNSVQAKQAEAARVQAETSAAEAKSYSEFMKNAVVALVTDTNKSYKILEKFDKIGMPPEREVI